jgi:hypothetical protein
MRRRSFFKFGILSAVASILKPQSLFAEDNIAIEVGLSPRKPVVIST